jgi:hypothetical protein
MGNELGWSEGKLNPLNTHRKRIPRNFPETRKFESPPFSDWNPQEFVQLLTHFLPLVGNDSLRQSP